VCWGGAWGGAAWVGAGGVTSGYPPPRPSPPELSRRVNPNPGTRVNPIKKTEAGVKGWRGPTVPVCAVP